MPIIHIHFEENTLFIHQLSFLLLLNMLLCVITLSASSLSIQRLRAQDNSETYAHTKNKQ
jgi:hypothetical protein